MTKQEYDLEKLHTLLEKTGLPPSLLDEEGNLVLGRVVRHYRERMKYVDPETGKEKHWTQKDLAKMLDVEDLMVHRMETKNIGLDSIERRIYISIWKCA